MSIRKLDECADYRIWDEVAIRAVIAGPKDLDGDYSVLINCAETVPISRDHIIGRINRPFRECDLVKSKTGRVAKVCGIDGASVWVRRLDGTYETWSLDGLRHADDPDA